MKRIFSRGILTVVVLSLFLSIQGIYGENNTTLDVTITSIFKDQETVHLIEDTAYGSSLTLDSNAGSIIGYTFAYFVVNGVVKDDLILSNNFNIEENTTIDVIFSPEGVHVVLFQDTNGDLLDMQYVISGEDATEPDITDPVKPGLIVAVDKWDTSLTNIDSNKVITIRYEGDTNNSYNLTVNNGSNTGTYSYNEEVTITADTPPLGEIFSHFEEDGQIISRLETPTITMLTDRVITAVYTTGTKSNAPFVSIGKSLSILSEHNSYIGQYYLSDDFVLVEYGMISNTVEEFDLTSSNTVIHQATNANPNTFEYLMSFATENYDFIRGYLIFKDSNDEIYEIYSDTRAIGRVTPEALVYETNFEDCVKGSYSLGTCVTNGETWTLNEALAGSLDNDQKDLTKSIRLRSGYIQTEFTVTNLYKIDFLHGKYLSNSASDFTLEISADKSTWITLDTDVPTTTSFTRYEFTLTEEVYADLSLNYSTPYYIRITHPSSERMNVDDFHVYSKGQTSVGIDPTNETTKQTDTMTLNVPEGINIALEQDEVFNQNECIAIDMILGEVTCSVQGTVDTSELGVTTVTYEAVDYEGNTHTEDIEIAVLRETSYLDIDYIGYYDGIEGLFGEELLEALRIIINEDIFRTSYDEARYLLDDIDQDPNNSNNVLLIYNGASVSGEWDAGVTWNREHVWPNSYLGIGRVSGSSRNIGSDLHNLRACDSGINSSRSNKVYDNTTTDLTYFPGNVDKGDAARILFYMVVMYEQLELTNEIYVQNPETNYTLDGAHMSVLNNLITWSYEDTVSPFEANRNQTIYEIQGNRNPFIDYSYLVELIWYDNPNIPE